MCYRFLHKMKLINMINTLVRFENVLCVFRNSSCLNRRVNYLVKVIILLDTCFVFFANWYYLQHYFELYPKDSYRDHISNAMNCCYFIFMTVNSLAAVFLSCYNSNHFKTFVFNIKAVHELYRNNNTFRSITKKEYRSCITEITVFAAGFAVTIVVFVLTSEASLGSHAAAFIFTVIISFEFCYYYENVVFYELIKVIVAPLMFLNLSIETMVEQIKSGYGEEYDDVLWGVRRELQKWGAASRHLVTASDRLCDSFGVQIALSFFSATIYNIIYLYQGISTVVTQKPPLPGFDVGSIAYSFTSFFAMKFLLVLAGQRAARQADRLQKNLVLLHYLLAGIPGEEASACARAAAGLARRLRAAPLRLRLLSAYAVQMALLAEILATIANYTIVLLQFNHVV